MVVSLRERESLQIGGAAGHIISHGTTLGQMPTARIELNCLASTFWKLQPFDHSLDEVIPATVLLCNRHVHVSSSTDF